MHVSSLILTSEMSAPSSKRLTSSSSIASFDHPREHRFLLECSCIVDFVVLGVSSRDILNPISSEHTFTKHSVQTARQSCKIAPHLRKFRYTRSDGTVSCAYESIVARWMNIQTRNLIFNAIIADWIRFVF